MANLVQVPARVPPETREKLLVLAERQERAMRKGGALSARVELADMVREAIVRGVAQLEKEYPK